MEKILERILAELQDLRKGQTRFETTLLLQREDISVLREEISALRKDVAEIKTELRYVWDDVKRIDNRLSAQDEQLASLKRLK